MVGEAQPLLEARALGKQFPGVRALHEVDLVLNPGEVLAVIGENGAGKSTLMKILAGVQLADAGEFFVDGSLVHFQNVRDAMTAGIALIHQELNLGKMSSSYADQKTVDSITDHLSASGEQHVLVVDELDSKPDWSTLQPRDNVDLVFLHKPNPGSTEQLKPPTEGPG